MLRATRTVARRLQRTRAAALNLHRIHTAHPNSTQAITQQLHPHPAHDLLRYVKKNKILPTLLHTVTDHHPTSKALLNAIQTGDATASIFQDPDCDIYLLHLLQAKKITEKQFIIAYSYLLALMQFTDQQALKPTDHDLRQRRNITVVPLVSNNALTTDAKFNLEIICKRFERIGHSIDIDKLTQHLLTLTPIEQWVIKISSRFSFERDDNDRILAILERDMPFVNSHIDEFDVEHYFIPSSSVMEYFIQSVSPHPVVMTPHFGSLGLNTLKSLHTMNQHPVALYSKRIVSNMPLTDGYRIGPFITWLHDVGHTLWGSMLSNDERTILFHEIIPKLEQLLSTATNAHDTELAEKIKRILYALIDFDLTNSPEYSNRSTRFATYLTLALGEYPTHPSYIKLGERCEHRLYFQLLHILHNDKTLSASHRAAWRILTDKLQVSIMKADGPTITYALAALAGAPTAHLTSKLAPIQHTEWLRLLSRHSDNQSLWNALVKDHHAELLTAILELKVRFFHPYVPMNDAMRMELTQTLKMRATQTTAENGDQQYYHPAVG